MPHPAPGAEPPEEEILAAEARHRLDTALRLREAATAEADPDRAFRLLSDALRLVRDLPGAEAHRRRLPPRPVPALHADIDPGTGGDGRASVRLSWERSPSTAGEVLYHVVRRTGRAPRDVRDGDAIGGALDERPPVNAPVYYAVFAMRGDAAAPPAVAGPLTVRPEPAEVELLPGDGQVTGRWRCPAEAARVVVVRDGQAVAAGRDGFREGVPNGRTHHYRICAVYLDPSGREVTTDGVRASATPSAPPEPVYELSAETDPADPGLVRARFDPPGHGTVELVLSDGPPPWPRSALVPLEEVRRETRRLAGTPASGGLAVRPGRGGWLLAVTVAEGTAAIGAYHRHVNLPPPRRLVAERRGAYVHVGFDWPPDVAEVDVVYRIGGGPRHGAGPPSSEAVTRAAYDTQGGVRLAVPEDEPVELSVAAAGTVGGARVTGPPVMAEVAARTIVRYDVLRSGPPWRKTLTVRLTSPHPLRVARLSLVLRTGKVMPHRAADGETLGVWEQVPVPGELSLDAPDAPAPYWLRCFADDDVVELSDPPVRPAAGPMMAGPLARAGIPGVPSRQGITCPYCFASVAPQRILFRCRGRAGRRQGCAPVLDEKLAEYTGSTAGASLPPVFAASGRKGRAGCPECGVPTGNRACPECHNPLPAAYCDSPAGSSRSSARRTPARAPTSPSCCTS
ncbi:hypothetical protein LUX57_10785 [Actinomadura madurae]|uniref:hypothetical protein n=3 Tax=Actinomadura madurae TaxID=1993 RepID=UPI0020D23355|nr:hypothetical protein [Actinomadura madurae]MCP9965559.1 hypothetical protein [Actinomadura madurae]